METLQEIIDRRKFLKATSAAAAAALSAGTPRPAVTAERVEKIEAKADTCILLWMAGGMASTDTYDPKRYQPFSKGVGADQVLSTFPAIDTAVDHIKLTKGFESIARVMDRGTLIRTQIGADLGFILHSRHQYHWHTGYEPPLTVAAPHLGAWLAQARGKNNPALPGFIDIGQRFNGGEREELKAFHTAGFLGGEFGPFMVPEPSQAGGTVRPPAGMSRSRFRQRYAAYKKFLKASPAFSDASDYQRQSLLRSLDNANRLLDSPAAKAFDLALEPKQTYEAYNTGRFGLGCLLARRLTETGARFIEVTTEYVPFKGFDTHENGHTRMAEMKGQIDRPIAQLVLELEQRGLLDRTLIVLASEFSRDMLVEGKPDKPVRHQVNQPAKIDELKFYGMHRHFTGAGSVLMFGGGVKEGFLYGKTADERPCTTIENPVSITDLHATIARLMGISGRYNVEVERRPFYITKDGRGRAVSDVIA
ncbi:MAG: DUF1501 domain-containing protein [Pirellulales bacterium]